MKKAEIVIIGGGVVGASVAFHLTKRGCRDVLILEREKLAGQGSTGRATGGVRAQFGTEINIRLSLYSLDFFDNWDHDCGYEPSGYLFLATDERQAEFLRTSGQRQRELGYEGVRMVDRQTAAAMVPGLNCDDVIAASFGPRDGFIDPLAVLDGFLSGALEQGGRVQYGTNVRSIEVEGGKVSGIKTADGRIECENVVLCTGAWARELAATAGIDLPVEPLRRQIVWARMPTALPAEMPMVIDLSDGFHFRPARNSRNEVLFACPDNKETSSFSDVFDESFTDRAFEKARHRAPFLCSGTAVREKCRAGLYEMTPDHHAILGGCSVEGLYLANGFSGHGVMHSPATGRALAEIILDGEAGFMDVSGLRHSRFAKGELFHETAFI